MVDWSFGEEGGKDFGSVEGGGGWRGKKIIF